MGLITTILFGVCLVRLMSIGLVAVWSDYCPIGLLSSWVTVCRVSVHRATVCWGCVLGEVSVRPLFEYLRKDITVSVNKESMNKN